MEERTELMAYFIGIGDIRYKVENERVFTMGGVEVDPITFVPINKNNPVVGFNVIHTYNNLYICDICGKEFDKRIALAGHARSHKGG